MTITDTRIKLALSSDAPVLAYCAVLLDDEFVLHDLKIVDGPRGVIVAMPSRRLTDKCVKCRGKNHLKQRYCGNCGAQLEPDRALRNDEGRPVYYTDTAHPLTADVRRMFNDVLIESYHRERGRAANPGYVCRFGDFFEPRRR